MLEFQNKTPRPWAGYLKYPLNLLEVYWVLPPAFFYSCYFGQNNKDQIQNPSKSINAEMIGNFKNCEIRPHTWIISLRGVFLKNNRIRMNIKLYFINIELNETNVCVMAIINRIIHLIMTRKIMFISLIEANVVL